MGILTVATSTYIIEQLYNNCNNYRYYWDYYIKHLNITNTILVCYKKVVFARILKHTLMDRVSNANLKKEIYYRLEEFLDRKSITNKRTLGKIKYFLSYFSELYNLSKNIIKSQKWTKQKLTYCLLYIFNQNQKEQGL